jgi:hypothetical protein
VLELAPEDCMIYRIIQRCTIKRAACFWISRMHTLTPPRPLRCVHDRLMTGVNHLRSQSLPELSFDPCLCTAGRGDRVPAFCNVGPGVEICSRSPMPSDKKRDCGNPGQIIRVCRQYHGSQGCEYVRRHLEQDRCREFLERTNPGVRGNPEPAKDVRVYVGDEGVRKI